MNKSFTLLELVVVIIILGVLATLGFTQYGRMVERGRGAEAKMIMGDIRKLAIAYRLANGSVTGMTNANVNIGESADQIPSGCKSTHYFSYGIDANSDPWIYVYAARCTAGGKSPPGVKHLYILGTNLVTGEDKKWMDYGDGVWVPGWQ